MNLQNECNFHGWRKTSFWRHFDFIFEDERKLNVAFYTGLWIDFPFNDLLINRAYNFFQKDKYTFSRLYFAFLDFYQLIINKIFSQEEEESKGTLKPNATCIWNFERDEIRFFQIIQRSGKIRWILKELLWSLLF